MSDAQLSVTPDIGREATAYRSIEAQFKAAVERGDESPDDAQRFLLLVQHALIGTEPDAS